MSPEAQPLAIVEKLRTLASFGGTSPFDEGMTKAYEDAISLIESDHELLALRQAAEHAQSLQRDINAGMVALNEAGKFAMELTQKLVQSEERVKRLEEALRAYEVAIPKAQSALDAEKDTEIIELRKRIAEVEKLNMLNCEDEAEEDTRIRDLCRPFLTPLQVDGNSYGVPMPSEVVQSALTHKDAEIERLKSLLKKGKWIVIKAVPLLQAEWDVWDREKKLWLEKAKGVV